MILLGPAGIGKGTQANLLSEKYDLKHVSSGDLFTKAVHMDTPLGQQIKSYTSEGKLIPDELAIQVILDYVIEDQKLGYILDGFPRTTSQAHALDEHLEIHAVLYFDAEEEVVMDRLARRIFCDCGRSYGPSQLPKIEGVCDICEGELYRRSDDDLEVGRMRFREYREKTRYLLHFYMKKIIPVDASCSIETVFERVCQKLEAKFPQ